MSWFRHRINGQIRRAGSMILLFLAFSTQAHRVSDSYVTLRLEGSTVHGQWDLALRDLAQVLPLDGNGDGEITRDELNSNRKEVLAFASGHLQLAVDGRTQTFQTKDLLLEQFTDGPYAVVRFNFGASEAATTITIDYRAFFDVDPQHRGLLRLEAAGRSQTAVFSPEKPGQSLEIAGRSRWIQFLEFLKEGVWHIWLGFDHILFLLALLLPSVLRRGENGWEVAEGFRPALIKVVKIVTAFTVAHSITLSLATLELVRLPPRLVESTIAASVILAAFNNLRPIFPDRGWIVAFVFGLIHGFGFANVLAELGLTRETLALALIGFNLGVEVGQLAIVAVFLPLAFSLRSSWAYRELTLRFGSALILLLATTWMIERLGDFKLLPF